MTITTIICNCPPLQLSSAIQTQTDSSASLLRAAIFGRNPKTTLIRSVIWIAVCIVLLKILFVHVQIDGISMQPTFQNKSTHWINRLAYIFHEPRRGDVVAIGERDQNDAKSFFAPRVMFLKRIIGLPGETVAFENGRALIDGKILDEPYEKNPCDWDRAPVTLDSNEYFVVGDNRTMPEEDHTFGICERHQIIGKILR